MTWLPFPPSTPLFISAVATRFSGLSQLYFDNTPPGIGAAAAWPAANRAIYIPFSLPFAYPVKRVWWINGATLGGNVDIAIYSALSLARLASIGSTAQSGASVAQYAAADWLLPPGEYEMAMAINSGTATAWRFSAQDAAAPRLGGMVQEASAFPLPAVMTPAANTTQYIPLFGLTRTASGF